MSAPAATRPLRVALVCMPWCAVDRPSIQVGLLAAIAREHGFAADTHHLNLELAAHLDAAAYHRLCQHRGRMTGEWLFGVAAFGEKEAGGADAAYFSAFPEERRRRGRVPLLPAPRGAAGVRGPLCRGGRLGRL